MPISMHIHIGNGKFAVRIFNMNYAEKPFNFCPEGDGKKKKNKTHSVLVYAGGANEFTYIIFFFRRHFLFASLQCHAELWGKIHHRNRIECIQNGARRAKNY